MTVNILIQKDAKSLEEVRSRDFVSDISLGIDIRVGGDSLFSQLTSGDALWPDFTYEFFKHLMSSAEDLYEGDDFRFELEGPFTLCIDPERESVVLRIESHVDHVTPAAYEVGKDEFVEASFDAVDEFVGFLVTSRLDSCDSAALTELRKQTRTSRDWYFESIHS